MSLADDPDFKAPYERLMIHVRRTSKDDEHDFQGWEDFVDDKGRIMGGEQVCTKCGLGAMAHSMRVGP